jgi:hypothetical protein
MDLRKKAAAFALEQARALSQHYRQARKEQEEADRADGDASSSSDDDNPFAPPPPKSVRIDNEEDESLKHHQHFIASLPFCPMDVGFLPSVRFL